MNVPRGTFCAPLLLLVAEKGVNSVLTHRLGHVVADGVRAVVTAGSLFIAGVISTQQGPVPPPTPGAPVLTGPEQILEIAIRQGGLLLVLIVVLFYYRRDYRTLTDFLKDQNDKFYDIIGANTKALTDDAAATREMSIVMHQTKNLLAQRVPLRRGNDDKTPH